MASVIAPTRSAAAVRGRWLGGSSAGMLSEAGAGFEDQGDLVVHEQASPFVRRAAW